MRATFTIDGVEYDADLAKFTNKEGMAVEQVTGMTFGEFAELAERGSMLAMTAIVWVMRRRSEPDLRFDDVEFDSTLQVEVVQEPGDPKTQASRPDPTGKGSKKDSKPSA